MRYCREQGQNTENTAKYCREQRWTAENRVIEALQRTGRQCREHDEIRQRTELKCREQGQMLKIRKNGREQGQNAENMVSCCRVQDKKKQRPGRERQQITRRENAENRERMQNT